jgi:hypothetical protein
VNTEERQLTDLLHRMTPEPPRRVTVEDIAFRLANEAGQGRQARTPRLREPRRREPHRRRPSWGRAWAPALAAAAVVVVAGGSAAVAVGLSSHPGRVSAGSTPTSNSTAPATPSSVFSTPAASPTSTAQFQRMFIKGGPYGADLFGPEVFRPGTLVSAENEHLLYGTEPGYLDQVNPVNGDVVLRVPDSAQVISAPVFVADEVWAVTSYGSSGVTLTGYNVTTLQRVASVQVPVDGAVSAAAAGVLATGPIDKLYVAAGDDVAVVSTVSDTVVKQISVPDGPVTSVAVSSDGRKLYVGTGSFTLLTYALPAGTQIASSTMSGRGAGANLVATSGGVWGTLGATVWFAPGGDLAKSFDVGNGAGAGGYSVPTLSGGTVWIGGSQTLVCASPADGKVLATASIPRDSGAPEYLGGVAVAGVQAFASYTSPAARQAGMALMTVPAACS